VSRITLGKITGVHGIKGEIKVMPYTQPPEAIAEYQPWHLERTHGPAQTLRVAQFRRQGEGLVVKLEGLDDRDEAKTLVGGFIVIDRKQLPALDEGHYWADLIGLQVSTIDGVDLGKVDYLFETGSNDVLVVKEGERERFIPYRLGDVVVEIDLEKGYMKVDWDPDF
jgi:16S rRNA processing protein RimM